MEFLQQSLDIAIGDPTAFLSNDRELKDSFLNGSKFLYDAANDAASASLGRTFGPFDVLLTDGMDSETVWEQLSSRNKPVTRFLKKGIQKLRTKETVKAKKAKEEEEEDDDAMEDEDEEEVYDDRKKVRNAPTPFIGTKKFDGVKPGYFFSKGSLGLGYYLDPSSKLDLTSNEDEDEEDDDDFEEGDDEDDEEDGEDVDEEDYDDDEDGGIDDLDSEGGSFDSNGHDDYDELEEGQAGGRANIEEDEDEEDEDDGGSGEDYEDGEGEDDDDDMSGDDDFSVDSQMDLGLYDDDDELINVSDRKKQKLEEYRKKDEARKNKNKNKLAAVVDDVDGGDEEEDELDDDDNEDSGDEDSDGDDDGSSADDDEDEEEEGDDTSTPVEPTSFAKRQAILQTQIKEYEANLVKDKSWELKGEVQSKDRPENSLLSVITDVERASKPVPIITQEYTTSIEDMIKKRIVDGKFNDVVKKLQSVDIIGSISRNGDDLQDVSQEKSKLGLGDIYAEQFMKDSASTKKEASAKKQAKDAEVKQLFDKACRELDALCHFFYSPRPVVADLSVKSLPVSSIAMEDPTPSFNSSHNSLAPQEVFDDKNGKRGFVKSEEEMTRDDRKRRRRHKKEINRKNASADGGSSNSNQNRGDDEIKDKRVVKASGKSDSVTNPVKKFSKSHQFFENLETLKMK